MLGDAGVLESIDAKKVKTLKSVYYYIINAPGYGYYAT
jgi:hypothetical protein